MSNSFKVLLPIFLVVCVLTGCAQIKDYMGLSPSSGSFVPQGEYLGTWKLIKGELEKVEELDKEVKITLFPMKANESQSSGILNLNDNSRRFYWRADGNSEDTWNILFAKDNNAYTDLTSDFSFDGILRKTSVGLDLEGSLKEQIEGNNLKYFVITHRYYKPSLSVGKEALAVTAGELLTIEGQYLGEDPKNLSARLFNKADSKEKELEVSSIDAGTFTIKIEKATAKGDYSLSVLRDKEYKSNTIDISIN